MTTLRLLIASRCALVPGRCLSRPPLDPTSAQAAGKLPPQRAQPWTGQGLVGGLVAHMQRRLAGGMHAQPARDDVRRSGGMRVALSWDADIDERARSTD
jgi:hypothetical protein